MECSRTFFRGSEGGAKIKNHKSRTQISRRTGESGFYCSADHRTYQPKMINNYQMSNHDSTERPQAGTKHRRQGYQIPEHGYQMTGYAAGANVAQDKRFCRKRGTESGVAWVKIPDRITRLTN